MAEFRWTSKAQLDLPEDLRSWIDSQELLHLVYEASHSVEGEDEQSSPSQLSPGAPRVLLAVLTYSYAIEVFASDEIERRSQRDPELSYLAANTTLSSNRLRNFRRFHRLLLRRTLSRLLQLAWERRRQTMPSEAPAAMYDHIAVEPGLAPWFDEAAEFRINQAVLADTMALDN